MNLKTSALPTPLVAGLRRSWRYPPLNALVGGTLLAILVLLALLGGDTLRPAQAGPVVALASPQCRALAGY